MLLQRGLGRLSRANWLDGVVAGLGAAALCAAFAFHAIQHVAGLGTLGTVVNLAYPVGDLLLLSLVIGGTVLLSDRGTSRWYLLAVGFVVIVVGDTFNLFSNTSALGWIALRQRLQRHRVAHRHPAACRWRCGYRPSTPIRFSEKSPPDSCCRVSRSAWGCSS